MKITVEYTLPEDQYEYRMAYDGPKTHNVLWEMDKWLRTQVKYAPDDTPAEAYKAYKECREKLYELLLDNSVDLYTEWVLRIPSYPTVPRVRTPFYYIVT